MSRQQQVFDDPDSDVADHAHTCPRCQRTFDHVAFTYNDRWNPLQRIVARALHRFYGACGTCIGKFIRSGQFDLDPEIGQLRTQETKQGLVFSQKRDSNLQVAAPQQGQQAAAPAPGSQPSDQG